MDQSDPQGTQSDGQAGSVLQRKARQGQEVRQTYAMSLAKALRLSFAKVADQQMSLALAVIAAKVHTCEQDALGDLFQGAPLLMLLDGRGGRRGAAVFDADLIGGLIQQQTMGKVTAPLGGDPRPMTDTDAAICAPFLEAVMARAAGLPDDMQDRALLEGYSFGARVNNTRLLLMALEQPEYHVIHLTLDVAGGVRQGHVTLCLPKGAATAQHLAEGEEGQEAVTAPPTSLDKTVLGLEVDLHVALTTLNMPLGQVQRMAVGEVFDLGITAFDEACVQTVQGRRLGAGVLGQLNGTRALQLEHRKPSTVQPRRRATDRPALNLPNVSGDGTGTRREDDRNLSMSGPDVFDGTLGTDTQGAGDAGSVAGLPALSDIPDMSDLPGLDALPDMSDLPGFDMDDLETGTG